jgi:hypothetical protein
MLRMMVWKWKLRPYLKKKRMKRLSPLRMTKAMGCLMWRVA